MGEVVRIAAKTPEAKRGNSVPHTNWANSHQSKISPIDQILFLQRTVGNQAVERLLKSGVVQTKLAIGKPGDIYEQEADKVAEQVMRMPEPNVSNKEVVSGQTQISRIQRVCTECEEGLQRQPIEEEEEKEVVQTKKASSQLPEVTSGTESGINSQKGGGQSLLESSRSFFEPRFGYDFSNVRVHTGSESDSLNRSLNARAFTTGHDIFFRNGEYNPYSSGGRELLAHELTHVIQKSANGQGPVSTTPIPPQIQRASIGGCTNTQTQLVDTAIDQAILDLSTSIPLLEPRPLSQKAQDAMWLTFRDNEHLKVFIVREFLQEMKNNLPNESIKCEQIEDYGSECKKGAGAYRVRGGSIYLCMGKWEPSGPLQRATTLIHEAAHYFFRGDPGYFGAGCEKSSETAGLSIAERFQNADSYSCLTYLLAHESEDKLRSRVIYYQREYRGETLEGIVQSPAGGIDLNSDSPFTPMIYIKFEGVDGVRVESPIPGAQYRWNIYDANGIAYPISFDPGQEGKYTNKSAARISLDTRQRLKSRGVRDAAVQCEVKIPGAEVDHFTLRLPVLFITSEPGQREVVAKILFATASENPADAAMNDLRDRLIRYKGILDLDAYHIDFVGHASRSGDDAYNQKLSCQRAQAVKAGIEFLIRQASGDPLFAFDPAQIKVEGCGEERAREEGKPETDDSPSDRVVEVVFEVK